MQQMENVMYVDNAPGSADLDSIFFVQVDATLCQACGRMRQWRRLAAESGGPRVCRCTRYQVCS